VYRLEDTHDTSSSEGEKERTPWEMNIIEKKAVVIEDNADVTSALSKAGNRVVKRKSSVTS